MTCGLLGIYHYCMIWMLASHNKWFLKLPRNIRKWKWISFASTTAATRSNNNEFVSCLSYSSTKYSLSNSVILKKYQTILRGRCSPRIVQNSKLSGARNLNQTVNMFSDIYLFICAILSLLKPQLFWNFMKTLFYN